MLAPISHRIPPPGYGPWERVASDLTEGLVEAGHDVTLFGPADTETSAELVATSPYPLDDWPRGEPTPDARVWEEMHIAAMAEMAHEGCFDIVHSHLHVHPLGYAPLLPTPVVTTLHGAAWNSSIHPALTRYADLAFVSISDAERRFFPSLRYVATVYNGIDCDAFPAGPGKGDYVLFVGRMAPEKAPHLAIEAARSSGYSIKLAGMVEPQHRHYFESKVQPALDGATVEYVGAMERSAVAGLYRDAVASLVPLEWDEPFGLVVVESLASGTPVVGWRRGALPELVRDGVTGALVDDVRGATVALKRIGELSREDCRRDAVNRFSIERMTEGYLSAYADVLGS